MRQAERTVSARARSVRKLRTVFARLPPKLVDIGGVIDGIRYDAAAEPTVEEVEERAQHELDDGDLEEAAGRRVRHVPALSARASASSAAAARSCSSRSSAQCARNASRW